MQGYTETIRKYAAAETHIGLLDNPDGTGEIGLTSEEAGRRLAVRFTLKAANERVQDIRFQVFGCGFTIAACAAAAELSQGRPLEEIRGFTSHTIDHVLHGLPEERNYCADLAIEALHAAVESVHQSARPIEANLPANPAKENQGPQIDKNDPTYRALMTTVCPSDISPEDRHLFACVLSRAGREPYEKAPAMGLTDIEINTLLAVYFPGSLEYYRVINSSSGGDLPPEINPDIRSLLLSHVDQEGGIQEISSYWLAKILAARAAHPGHLWVAMGLFERPELTAAIRRHLPTLAQANHQGMRWKRYLFKQICEMNGGTMCKSPNCGDCSDYPICFGEN